MVVNSHRLFATFALFCIGGPFPILRYIIIFIIILFIVVVLTSLDDGFGQCAAVAVIIVFE